jgi:hypothetical protein
MALIFGESDRYKPHFNRNAGERLDAMKDNPDLAWCKEQILRVLADYDARIAGAVPSGRALIKSSAAHSLLVTSCPFFDMQTRSKFAPASLP